MPKQSLTIYLIKDAYSADTECIRQEELASLTSIDVDLEGATNSRLYLRRNRPKYPKWRALFPDIDWARYMTNTFSGLLITNVSGRRFAIAGGSGRYLLNPFGIEAGFGFKTVVNSVDPTTIRKIEKKTINQNPMSSIEQLTRTSGLQDFQVDYYTDIVSKIRAKSTIEELGTIVDGRDSLQISIDCDADEIPMALTACLAAYASDRYLEYFPNIDNIAAVGDIELTDALDDFLVQRLNQGNLENCWASMPEIVQDENFDCFQYSRRGSALRFHDIELPHCLAKYTDNARQFSKADLERDEIFVRTLDDEVFPRWRVWHCIYSELLHAEQLYVLIEGAWYRVSQEFVQKLDEQISEIPQPDFQLPNWRQHDHEPVYLRALADDYLVLDRQFIRIEGQAPIELCDLYQDDRTLIHVKRYGSSEVLSHLFNQGRVAAKLLISDRHFRISAQKLFPNGAPFGEDERPDPRLYKVVFFIGSKFGGAQTLPLFAKVVLVDTFNELRNYGFAVELGFIQVDLI